MYLYMYIELDGMRWEPNVDYVFISKTLFDVNMHMHNILWPADFELFVEQHIFCVLNLQKREII